MAYTQRKMNGTRPPWLAQPMPDRGLVIAGICIHSSRGGAGSSVQNDGRATENWMGYPGNRGKNPDGTPADWGGSCDLIIFGDGTRVIVCDWDSESPTYGAGYGEQGSWNCSRYYLQVELAQHTNDAPFDPRTIDSFAEWTAEMAIRYDFPIVRLPFLTQKEQAIPRGITAHDASMNGRKLGKTDPGSMFPWGDYIAKANEYRRAMEGQAPPTAPDLTRVKALMDEGYNAAFAAMNASAAAFAKWEELFVEMRAQFPGGGI